MVSTVTPRHEIIGFVPYWLSSKAKKDYSPYITTLTYFGLTVDSEGHIVKLANAQEEDPGWHALRSGAMNSLFADAKKDALKLSLLIFIAHDATIHTLIAKPKEHAKTLISEVSPIMKKYGFKDLNLDFESASIASEESQMNFTQFVSEIKHEIQAQNLGTLTVETSPTALYRNYLLKPKEIAPIVDYLVFMTYDYHHQNSLVTGPVAPLTGAGSISEFDVAVVMYEALKIMPQDKIIMGVPLYGYEWETIDNTPRSAVIPGTGITASNARVEDTLATCPLCSPKFDTVASESYVIYKDEKTDTYHQIYYPDKHSMKEKVLFAKTNNLGGIGLWALGYEGTTILEPLKDYK